MCVWLEAYTFVELFCGEGWVSRVMRTSGCCTASLDIRLGIARDGKQNPFDLTTDSGFLLFDYNRTSFYLQFLFGQWEPSWICGDGISFTIIYLILNALFYWGENLTNVGVSLQLC